MLGSDKFSLQIIAMALIISVELLVLFLSNVGNYGSHFTFMGRIMDHISANAGGIMGPNFESE